MPDLPVRPSPEAKHVHTNPKRGGGRSEHSLLGRCGFQKLRKNTRTNYETQPLGSPIRAHAKPTSHVFGVARGHFATMGHGPLTPWPPPPGQGKGAIWGQNRLPWVCWADLWHFQGPHTLQKHVGKVGRAWGTQSRLWWACSCSPCGALSSFSATPPLFRFGVQD